MRGVGDGRHRNRPEDPDRTDEHEAPPEPGDGGGGAHWEAHPARGGYLGGAYPASPPPAEAPASGPDPQSADPYYQRPEYPTDPGGIALPDLQGKAADDDVDAQPGAGDTAER